MPNKPAHQDHPSPRYRSGNGLGQRHAHNGEEGQWLGPRASEDVTRLVGPGPLLRPPAATCLRTRFDSRSKGSTAAVVC